MSGRRALRGWIRRRSTPAVPPPAFWGRVGAYEAVFREGMLFLLAPEPAHPTRRASG